MPMRSAAGTLEIHHIANSGMARTAACVRAQRTSALVELPRHSQLQVLQIGNTVAVCSDRPLFDRSIAGKAP